MHRHTSTQKHATFRHAQTHQHTGEEEEEEEQKREELAVRKRKPNPPQRMC